jgi:hypothetical protein
LRPTKHAEKRAFWVYTRIVLIFENKAIFYLFLTLLKIVLDLAAARVLSSITDS